MEAGPSSSAHIGDMCARRRQPHDYHLQKVKTPNFWIFPASNCFRNCLFNIPSVADSLRFNWKPTSSASDDLSVMEDTSSVSSRFQSSKFLSFLRFSWKPPDSAADDLSVMEDTSSVPDFKAPRKMNTSTCYQYRYESIYENK